MNCPIRMNFNSFLFIVPDPDLNVILRPTGDKRALSMFNRFHALNNIGKNRPPIRSILYETDNPQNRGRLAGQPLRWG